MPKSGDVIYYVEARSYSYLNPDFTCIVGHFSSKEKAQKSIRKHELDNIEITFVYKIHKVVLDEPVEE